MDVLGSIWAKHDKNRRGAGEDNDDDNATASPKRTAALLSATQVDDLEEEVDFVQVGREGQGFGDTEVPPAAAATDATGTPVVLTPQQQQQAASGASGTSDNEVQGGDKRNNTSTPRRHRPINRNTGISVLARPLSTTLKTQSYV